MADLSNFKSTAFVSQYKGLPIDEFLQSATALQQRNIQNRDRMDQLELAANSIKTLAEDDPVKMAQLQAIRDEQERIAQSGAYEHAGDLVRMQAKDFATNAALKQAQANLASYTKQSEEFSKLSPAQQIKLQRARAEYKGVGEGDEFGRFNTFASISAYEDQNINELVDKYVDDWKESGSESAVIKGGYIKKYGQEAVTEAEVRDGVLRMLQTDPKIRRQLEDEARYENYQQFASQIDENGQMMGFRALDMDPSAEVFEDAQGNKMSTLDYVSQRYADPYAIRESYKKTTADIKADPNFGGGGGATAGMKSTILTHQSSAFNLGNLPTGSEYQTELANLGTQISSYDEILNDPAISAEEKEKAQRSKDDLLSKQALFANLKEDYLSGLPQDKSFAAKFADAIAAAGLSTDNVASAYMQSSDRGANDNATQAYAEKMAEYRDRTKQIYDQVYQQEFGQPAPNQVRDYNAILRDGSKVNDAWFSSDDFEGHMNQLAEQNSFSPTVVQFNQTAIDAKLPEQLRTTLSAGNIRAFNSDNVGEFKDTEVLRNAIASVPELTINGITSETAEGYFTEISIPVLSDKELKKYEGDVADFLEEHAGQEFIVQELGSDNVATLARSYIEGSLREVERSLGPGGLQAAQQKLQTAVTMDDPYRFGRQIEAIQLAPTEIYHKSAPVARIVPKQTAQGKVYQVVTLDANGNAYGDPSEFVSKERAKQIVERIYNPNYTTTK